MARDLYRQAIGTRFEGPAKIGLLRLDLAQEWQAEAERTDRVAASFKPELTDDPAALVVVAKEAVASVLVIDREGRRVFSDSLAPGQEFRVPAGRDDLLLSVGQGDTDKLLLRFKSRSYDLPKGKDAVLVRLDRNTLARDNRVSAAPDAGNEKSVWRLPAETTRASRISVESIASSSVYIHSEDDVLGFEDSRFHAGRKIAVPNVAGLVLEIRALELDRPKDAAVALTVDGTRPLKLAVPADCLARIELDATALRAARPAIGAPTSCDSLSEGESRDLRPPDSPAR
jgi:hypothetical protein